MSKTLFWIYISSIITLVSARINYDKLSDRVKRDIRHKWEECCKTNTCIYNSCYSVQWAPFGWATVRQRCQSQYPEWPYTVDIFRIQNESDLRIFWNMLQDHVILKREKPKTLWTSGVRCPKGTSDISEFQTRWISTNQPFPAWLEEKINNSSNSHKSHSNTCEFLAISLSPDDMDVKYEFQNQNVRHATICEFTIPDAEWTTQSGITTESPTEQTKPIIITKEHEVTVSTVTDLPTRGTTTSYDNQALSSTETKVKSSRPPTLPTKTSTFAVTSTNSPGYCRSVNESGIYWPDTLGGEIALGKCPEGMTGIAEWKCNKETLKFQPEKPHIEGCKHEWIVHIEDSIRNQDDAVGISTKLSRETRKNNMSHGDIIALVNLTSSLFRLYTEQKGEEEFEVSQSEEVPTYYNFTKTMISSISNILRVEIKDAWEGLNETRQTKEASTILKLVTTIGSRLSCIRTSSEKLQFTVSEQNIDLQTFILNKTNEDNDVIRFPQETKNMKANSSIQLPANLQLKKWFSPCKTYNSAVGVIYKNVGYFLKAGQLDSDTIKVATKVLSFSLSNSTESIPLSEGEVNITLQHLEAEGNTDKVFENPRCVFWNFSKSEFGEWDESGCYMLYSNETHTVCQCNHLTNFAVLMDINDNVGDNDILTWLTYVCCGVSCITLILTLICFVAIRSLHGRRSIITGNLCLSLLISNALIIFGLDKTKNKIACSVVAGILHYWILSAFCWMLVEGYHLYRMVILVFQRGSNLPVKYYYLFAYGVPLIVVGISAGVRKEGYGGEKYCWLSASDRGLMWSFVGPACAIILVNIVIFVLTLRSASSVKIKKEQSTVKKIKSWVRGSISVMCLLGLTWCIGLFYINPQFHFFSYIFIILNGLQGVFIFSFHILLNEKVNSFFSCKGNIKFGKKKFLNHTSSNQTNSKTSTRTSMNSLACTSSTRLADSRNMLSNQHYNAPTSRSTVVTNNKIEPSDAVKKSYKKNKVTHMLSANGLNPQSPPYDSDIRIRSQSTSNTPLYGKHYQVSQKSNLTPL